MRTYRLLDLFCGGGGAARGYQQAGFHVTGLDIRDQPSYPGDFHRLDVTQLDPRYLLHFDAVHASPPCQLFCAYTRSNPLAGGGYPDLVSWTRSLLATAPHLPYLVENVPDAPLIRHRSVGLCGTSFGLRVRRHRLLETNLPLYPAHPLGIRVPPCVHDAHHQRPEFPGATNRRAGSRRTVEIGAWRVDEALQQEAMGIDWLLGRELSEAIPPAYTRHLGFQLRTWLDATHGTGRVGP